MVAGRDFVRKMISAGAQRNVELLAIKAFSELNVDWQHSEQLDGHIEVEIAHENLKRIQNWVPTTKLKLSLCWILWFEFVRPTTAGCEPVARNPTGYHSEGRSSRNTLGITGAGVKVGVISHGANNLASTQGSGDLPLSISVYVVGLYTTCHQSEKLAKQKVIIDDLGWHPTSVGTAAMMASESWPLVFSEPMSRLDWRPSS